MQRNRRRLGYEPIPRDLRKRVRPKGLVPMYISYITKTGKLKTASWKVEFTERGKKGHQLFKSMCNRIKRGLIPLVENGHVFKGFGDLFYHTRWMRVRKIRTYRKGRIKYVDN